MAAAACWGIFSLLPAIPAGNAPSAPALLRPASHAQSGRVMRLERREAT